MPIPTAQQHQSNRLRSLDLRSEGAIDLVKDLLQSGYSVRIRVTGHSMRPFFKGDEIVTLQKISQPKLRRGDIVLYKSEEGFPILHRIVRLRKDKQKKVIVQTKGDGLVGLDATVESNKIIGRVCMVELSNTVESENLIVFRKDLSSGTNGIISYLIAWRELLRNYLYRIKKRSTLLTYD